MACSTRPRCWLLFRDRGVLLNGDVCECADLWFLVCGECPLLCVVCVGCVCLCGDYGVRCVPAHGVR